MPIWYLVPAKGMIFLSLATIDGIKLKELDKYKTHSDFFNITIPEDNAYDADPSMLYLIVLH